MAVTRYGVINIGSHELNMEIYDISASSGIQKVDQIRHMVPLGKDAYSEKSISFQVLDEICRVLQGFMDIMKGYRVNGFAAIATSAFREAENNTIVLDQIRVRTGIEVKVLSNSEQRYIYYKAVASRQTNFNKIIEKATAFVDVGAGSSQISLFDKKRLVTTQNIKLGSVRLRERLRTMDLEMADKRRILGELVDNDIQTFHKLFLKDREIKNIIAVGDPLVYFVRKMLGNDTTEWIKAEELQEVYHRVMQVSLSDLADKMDLSIESVSLILPALTIYKRLLDKTNAQTVWIPNVSLCDGIAADYANKKKLVKLDHDFTEDILLASRNIAKRYMTNNSHTSLLEEMVCKIFDSMHKYHGLGKRERLLLQISAILHDCGKYISMSIPVECSYNIIMSTEIIGLSHMEREMVANIVRFNTKEMVSYERFQGHLTEKAYLIVMKLTALLRLANAMDRSHRQKIKNVKVSMKNQQLLVVTDTTQDITLERERFEQKADFFEEIYGIRPVLKQKRGIK